MLGTGLLKDLPQNFMGFHDRENGATERDWQANSVSTGRMTKIFGSLIFGLFFLQIID
jgi:hypothetical protein